MLTTPSLIELAAIRGYARAKRLTPGQIAAAVNFAMRSYLKAQLETSLDRPAVAEENMLTLLAILSVPTADVYERLDHTAESGWEWRSTPRSGTQ